LEGLGLWL